jgi:hypothetical protein
MTVATEGADDAQTASLVTARTLPSENDTRAENCALLPSAGATPVTETFNTTGVDGARELDEPPQAVAATKRPARIATANPLMEDKSYLRNGRGRQQVATAAGGGRAPVISRAHDAINSLAVAFALR